MKTIYLHIGLGKTGTTAIQKYMGLCCEDYLFQGLRYIQSAGGATGVGHQSFAKQFITNPPEYMQINLHDDAVKQQVALEIENCQEDVLLMSSENFPLADPVLVKAFFDSLQVKLNYKILLFVRSQDELAESEYNQMIKVRKETRSFEAYTHEEFEGNFMKIVQAWEDVFSRKNMICKVFDAVSNSAIVDFIKCLPTRITMINEKKTPMEMSTNKSLGYANLLIKRMFNILEPSNKKNAHIELHESIKKQFDSIDLPALHMNSVDAKRMRLSYKESNIVFNQRYLTMNSQEIGGRRYSNEQRDDIFQKCMMLSNVSKI